MAASGEAHAARRIAGLDVHRKVLESVRDASAARWPERLQPADADTFSMTSEPLPSESTVDAHLDDIIRQTCKEKAFSKWALLTRSTDRIRIALMSGATNFSLDLAGIFHAALRYAFRSLSRLNAAGQLPGRPHFTESQARAFHALLKDLQTYDQIARLYAFAHDGLISMQQDGSRITCELKEDIRPLELFEIMDNTPPSVTGAVYFGNFLSHDPNEHVRLDPDRCLESRILRSTSKGGRYRVRYNFDPGVLRLITEHFIPTAGVCPEGWTCAGLDWSSVKKFNASLMALAYHQTVAVFGGGRLHRIVGIGDNQIVCMQTGRELKALLGAAADLRGEELDVLFELYTYDEAVSWADPALTPIIPLQGDICALDPALVMLSNWERNTLKVLARGKPSDFDSVSGAFETAMLTRISASLQSFGVSVKVGRTIAGEEIDLLAFDATTGVLMIVEAKWEIRASDPIEMVRARQSAKRKHAQLKRKVDVLAQNIDCVAAAFGCEASAIKRHFGVVVLDGNMGLPRSSTVYPVVPGGALDAVVSTSTSLLDALESLDAFSWAPKVNDLYEVKEQDLEFAGLTFTSEASRVMWENFSEYTGWRRTPHAKLYRLGERGSFGVGS